MDSMTENMKNHKTTVARYMLSASYFLIFSVLFAQAASAASVTLTWDRNQEPDIAGYKIYWGTSSRNYQNSTTVYDSATQPLKKSYNVSGLDEGRTYYFAVTAFDMANQESNFSHEIVRSTPAGNENEDSSWDEWYENQNFLEIGSAKITSFWKTIYFSGSRAFQHPVIIVSPPTYNEHEPCIVRIRNVTPYSFQIRIQEWLYLNWVHTSEEISFMVIEKGTHIMPDGSVWQAGTYILSGNLQWRGVNYVEAFEERPLVFNSSQTYNGSAPFTVRMTNSTAKRFTAAIQEEERRNYGHTYETIGYLAVEPSGDLNIQEIPCNHHYAEITDDPYGPQIFIEEERSRDSETWHVDEQTGILIINDHIFAHMQTTAGGDTAAIRIVK